MTDEPDDEDDETEDEFVHSHTQAGGQDTSREAAHKAFTSSAHVKALIRGQLALGPRIDEKLEDALAPIADSTVCARRADLVREGKVTKHRDENGKVLKELNRRGNPCIMWRLVEKGEVVAIPTPPKEQRLRAALTVAIVESLQDREGCGSDLYSVGDELEDDTWLYVYGNLDVHHLVSDVLATIGRKNR